MTVQHNQIVEGQNIVQWNFTGANNQKWRLEYAGNSSGNYRFLAYNTNLALSMASVSVESGIQAKLASKANDSRQLMYPTDELSNGSHRIWTRSSNSMQVLVVNNASISSGVSIVQGSTGSQWNDQWLIEPVNTSDSTLGVHYGSKNYNHRLATYPDFDYYTHTDKKVYESTNFVSQCLAASGYNYYRPGTYSTDWWYVDKRNHVQNQYYDFNGLTDNWTVTQNWYEPGSFRNFWVNTKNMSTQTISNASYITNFNSTILNGKICYVGDAVLIKKTENGTQKIVNVLFSTSFATGTNLYYLNCVAHSSNNSSNNATLGNILEVYGTNNLSNYSIEIIHIL